MSTLPVDMSTLTKRLAGPSTAKAGMDTVDQAKVNDIIYKASEVFSTLECRVLIASGKQILRERAEERRRADEEDRRYVETPQSNRGHGLVLRTTEG